MERLIAPQLSQTGVHTDAGPALPERNMYPAWLVVYVENVNFKVYMKLASSGLIYL